MTVNAGLVSGVRWKLRVQFNDEAGAPLSMTGYTFRARMWRKDLLGGTPVFEWKQSGGGAGDGTISAALAAQGAIDLTATKTQHAAVTAGDYNWHLEDITTAADPVRLAAGRLQVGPDGTLVTAFWVEDSFDGSIATGTVPVDGAAIAAQAVAAALAQGLSVETVSGTTVDVTTARSGKLTRFTSNSDVSVRFANSLPAGFSWMWRQVGTGQLTFSMLSGGSLENALDYTKSLGQKAVGGAFVDSNPGTAPVVSVFGDMVP